MRRAACSTAGTRDGTKVEPARKPMRRAWGKARRSISRRFTSSSSASITTPVTLPPGRARLTARPSATGSVPAKPMTMGVCASSARIAWAAGLETAMITSGRAAIISAASGVRRAASPFDVRAIRLSVRPSMKPSRANSGRPHWRNWSIEICPEDSRPSRATRPCAWAGAASANDRRTRRGIILSPHRRGRGWRARFRRPRHGRRANPPPIQNAWDFQPADG